MLSVHDILKATSGELLCRGSDSQIKGVSIDSRNLAPGDLFIAIKGGKFDGHDFIHEALKKKAAAIVCSRRILIKNTPIIKVKDTTKALGQIANYYRKNFDIPVIAVTGSNGKTTTKDMIAWILSAKLSVLKNKGTKNNAIGLPLTLLELRPGHGICVLEVGTNHFGEVKDLTKIAEPNIGLIMNIGYSHLEFLKNLSGVYKEKSCLIKGLINPAIGILNIDDNFFKESKQSFKGRFIINFGIKNKAELRASGIKLSGKKIEFIVNGKHRITLNTCGQQNVYNALAAIAVARLFGLDYKTIGRRLKNFVFPEGRLRCVQKNKINFIDDTYNSNPLSLDCALNALEGIAIKGRKIFVMGDMLELGGFAREFHQQAAERINRVCDCFIAVGELAGITAKAVKEKRLDPDGVFICACAKEARSLLLNKIIPAKDDMVLVKGSRRLAMEEVLR